MRFLWILLPLLLWGCTAGETMETVSDEAVQPVMASPREISVRLPEDALSPVLNNETRQIYMSEDYELLLETRPAGDLKATIRDLSGFEPDALTVMQTQWDAVSRYEFVWAAAGEQGARLGRAVVLDDGQYHYCLSVLRDAEAVSQVVWRDVFASFTLI